LLKQALTRKSGAWTINRGLAHLQLAKLALLLWFLPLAASGGSFIVHLLFQANLIVSCAVRPVHVSLPSAFAMAHFKPCQL
jgi:hypothetical protein